MVLEDIRTLILGNAAVPEVVTIPGSVIALRNVIAPAALGNGVALTILVKGPAILGNVRILVIPGIVTTFTDRKDLAILYKL